MTWEVPSATDEFVEAVAWFRKRVPLRKESWNALVTEARERAFTVSGVAQLDLVYDVSAAIDDAVAKGTTLDDFKKTIGEKLEAAWGGTVAEPAWRLETIFRTNVQQAYAAGRYNQATDPFILEERPVWMFDAVLDSRTTQVCRECDGTVLPADDPWWKTHLAPLHFNCRSGFLTLTDEQAQSLGGVTKKPTNEKPLDGFGAPPGSAAWEPDPAKYPADLWAAFNAKE